MASVLGAKPLRPLHLFRLAVHYLGGVISHMKCPVLVKDVPALIPSHVGLQYATSVPHLC